MDRPPFDPVRAGFWLIVGVLAFQGIVGLIGLAHCVWWSERIVEGKYSCDNINATLNQLLTGALAAAMAFLAGRKDKS